MVKILFIDNGMIKTIDASKFKDEAMLQDYLEQYPELLPLHEIEDSPPPMITIGREVPVPSGAMDLLFLDTGGRLTVVETKLAKNPQARREVIGQIIEYASYVCGWDADQIERQANEYLRGKGADQNGLYGAFASKMGDAGIPLEPDAFRSKVEDNLHRGSIRLVIAVDELVEPLRSTVTFLNTFSTFDLLILQLRDFKLDSNKHVFIPSLFGYSKPPPPPPPTWDEESFLADARKKRSEAEFQLIYGLYQLACSTGRAEFGRGTTGGSFACRVSPDGRRWFTLFIVFNNYGIQLGFGDLRWKGIPEEVRVGFLNRLNTIPGITLPEDVATATVGKYPSIPFLPLTQGEALERFGDAIRWLREQVLSFESPEETEGARGD